MVDQYVEVTDAPGCFGRLKDSIAKVGIGFIMILISFPLLFWNEGRAVKRAQDLEFGRGSVETIKSDKIDSGKNGSLVHTTGKVAVKGQPKDDKFGVTANAVALQRDVEMYQWKENKKTEKKGDKDVTTYRYEETWSSSSISSSGFKKPGYDNPSFPFETKTFYATDVTLGAYGVSADLRKQWGVDEDHNVTEKDLAGFTKAAGRSPVLDAGGVYYGTPGSPAIGDLKVKYRIGATGDGSAVAGLKSGSLIPFTHKEMNDSIAMFEKGTKSADAMFEAAEDANVMLTWGLRLAGFLLMFMGFNLLFGPFDTLIRMIPIVGAVIDFGTTLIAGLLAFALTFITIAIGWIFYRPLIGILLLLVGVGAIAGIIFLAMKAKKKSA